jgi:hypothetical protein
VSIAAAKDMLQTLGTRYANVLRTMYSAAQTERDILMLRELGARFCIRSEGARATASRRTENKMVNNQYDDCH